MSFIYRRLNKLLLLFFFLGGSVYPESGGDLETLSGKISRAAWTIFKCRVVQTQGNDIWEDDITIISLGENNFEIDASEQIVQVKQDTVWTFIKKDRRVAIDHYYKDAPNIFYFLTGNFGSLVVVETTVKNGLNAITFNDTITGYTGTLFLDRKTADPVRLKVQLDKHSDVTVAINEFITGESDQPLFFAADSTWSIVDLRE